MAVSPFQGQDPEAGTTIGDLEALLTAIRSDSAQLKQELFTKLDTHQTEQEIATGKIREQLADHERFLVQQGKRAYQP